MREGTRTMKAKANLFGTLLALPVVLLAALLVASAPALGQEGSYLDEYVYPHDQETGVYRDTNVRMNSFVALDRTTVNTDTFTLVKQGTTTPVEATVTYDAGCEQEGYSEMWFYCAAVLDPQADLEANTTYTATVKGGDTGVKYSSYSGTPTMPEDFSWSFTTGDTTRPPETTITSGPCGPFYRDGDIYQVWPCKPTTSTSATFAFTSSEANSTFECSLDSAAFTSCTSPKAYTGLSDGNRTFQVRATDASGITDPTPAGDGWTIDATAPTISVTSPADGATYQRGASIYASYSCSDSADSSPQCTGPVPSGALINTSTTGTKTFTVSAKDSVGNPNWKTVTYYVKSTLGPDTTAPKVDTLKATSVTSTGAPRRATDFEATFSEKMDASTLSPSTFKLFKCSSTTSTTCTTQITTTPVKAGSDGLSATLNPFGSTSTTLLLQATTKYKVVVTTGAKDVAGNALDQDPSTTGNQQKVGYFTTGSG
jgi:hypothetical protein